jgi:hypothetical protein
MSDIDLGKQAKDIAEAADTSVDAVKKLASFLDGVFGNVISNSFGLMSDKLAYYRLEKAIALQEAVEEKLRKRGTQKRYVPLAFGLPSSRRQPLKMSRYSRKSGRTYWRMRGTQPTTSR